MRRATTTRDAARHQDRERFAFGRNWQQFVEEISGENVACARASFLEMSPVADLAGMEFLDVGCGSGLSSLVARQLGARVTAFDFDPDSVKAAVALLTRYNEHDSCEVLVGSILDDEFLEEQGLFDYVYAWGVLHHTGDMWRSLDNACGRVCRDGYLHVALYNDQGRWSRWWLTLKKRYVRSGSWVRRTMVWLALLYFWTPIFVLDVTKGNPGASWREYSKGRGMSPMRDVVDWIGGYPFEVATPEAVFCFISERGFRLVRLKTAGGDLGNNEFVFRREV